MSQICVAPDYLMVATGGDHSVLNNVIDAFKVAALLTRTKGKAIVGGKVDAERLKIETNNFGPIFPVVKVSTFEDVCNFVSNGDHPLVLYTFTENDDVKSLIRDNTTSGNIVYNDTFIQLAGTARPRLSILSVYNFSPGVGESGHGRQTTRYGFELFTIIHHYAFGDRTILRYPPYTDGNLRVLNQGIDMKVPTFSLTEGILSH
ncbi:uncharacterized protein BT62DRAFT_1081171 [Guyanagaster necrorhizus]|uniref:Aldehyde dehydrogenase n=1 Tax=Guyanagaster necrorhizus TaxID=856835 RepID=A0A9P7VH64_9AGAR|nr:uncharacterized protein BT62DRAFT_1081171 [Guyanagaster necrorhizus MCA 3950]KAG7439991.1 hypothetical protein BT62DRAFT_1081171 [Guyanagaster necrorhizus MCA 3950]